MAIERAIPSAQTNTARHGLLCEARQTGGISMRSGNLSLMGKNPIVTEYAIILAVLAIIVFVTYETMGQDIGALFASIHT